MSRVVVLVSRVVVLLSRTVVMVTRVLFTIASGLFWPTFHFKTGCRNTTAHHYLYTRADNPIKCGNPSTKVIRHYMAHILHNTTTLCLTCELVHYLPSSTSITLHLYTGRGGEVHWLFLRAQWGPIVLTSPIPAINTVTAVAHVLYSCSSTLYNVAAVAAAARDTLTYST